MRAISVCIARGILAVTGSSRRPYGVPKNSSGNALSSLAKFPFFRSSVSVAIAIAELKASCTTITDDRKAIAVYGGGSSYYIT